MYYFFLFLVLISIGICIGQEYDDDDYYPEDPIDPEIALCEELSLDAAVTADDNIGYVFKGDFYWQISTISGISPNFIARYINTRWDGLTGPIDAAFTIDDKSYGFSTVFIKGNEWFLYKMNKFQTNGSLDDWPYIMPERPVMSAFEYYNTSLKRKDYPIYLLYDTNKFIEYIFNDIKRPTHVITGTAYRKWKILYWLFDTEDDKPGTTIESLVSASAVMANEKILIMFGDKHFCSADITELAPICLNTDTEKMSKFFGCPRNEFPTTTTTTTTTTTPTTMTTTISTTTKTTRTTSTTTTKTTRPPTFPKIKRTNKIIATTTTPKTTITTTLPTTESPVTPIKSSEWTSDDIQQIPTFTEQESEDENQKEKTNKRPKSPLILVIIIIAIICLIILFVILFFYIKNNIKKRKKSSPDNKDKEKANISKSDSSALSGREPTDPSSKQMVNKSSDLTPSSGTEMSSEVSTAVSNSDPASPESTSIRSESIESLNSSDAKQPTDSPKVSADKLAVSPVDPKKSAEADQMMDKIKSRTESE